MEHGVIIIGAGVAGLATGSYLRMNGYDTEILEMHTLPGGLCTAWKRNDYTFDTCLHWLVGSRPGNPFYDLWSELVPMSRLTFVDRDVYLRVEDAEGRSISFHADVERLEKELLEKAPEDREFIRSFIAAVRKLTRFSMSLDKAPELMNFFDGAKMMLRLWPYLNFFRRWASPSLGELAARCRNPLLARAVRALFYPEMSAFFGLYTLALMHNKQGGYPLGGSRPFAHLLEQRFLDLGGRIRYRSRVKRILVEDGRATGVEIEGGETVRAGTVISAADGHATIFDLLGGKFVDNRIRHDYETLHTFPSYLQVSLGVGSALGNVPGVVVLPLDPPVELADGSRHEELFVHVYHEDPGMAPAGKRVVTSLITTPHHAWWTERREGDPEAYRLAKERVAELVIDTLENRFGGIRRAVETVDVSTPATVIRYTGNWKGSFEGWVLTGDLMTKRMKRTLPGLDRFYLAGQWVEPGGGLPSGLLSGRNVAQVICRRDGRKFTTTRA